MWAESTVILGTDHIQFIRYEHGRNATKADHKKSCTSDQMRTSNVNKTLYDSFIRKLVYIIIVSG